MQVCFGARVFSLFFPGAVLSVLRAPVARRHRSRRRRRRRDAHAPEALAPPSPAGAAAGVGAARTPDPAGWTPAAAGNAGAAAAAAAATSASAGRRAGPRLAAVLGVRGGGVLAEGPVHEPRLRSSTGQNRGRTQPNLFLCVASLFLCLFWVLCFFFFHGLLKVDGKHFFPRCSTGPGATARRRTRAASAASGSPRSSRRPRRAGRHLGGCLDLRPLGHQPRNPSRRVL